MAKKTPTKKKTTKKSAAASKKTSKPAKKTPAKKAPARAAAKRAPAKKSPAKKPPAAKAATKKKPLTKKTTAKKPTTKKTTKKTTKAAASKSKKKTTKKGASTKAESSAKSTPKSGAQRFRAPYAADQAGGRQAAAKLAEAAGLTSIRAASIAVATKARKYKRLTTSPLTAEQLAEFRQMLVDKRRQLVGDVTSMENEALGGDGGSLSHLPQHMADQGSDTFEQSLNLDLAASQRGMLKEIDDALDRIANDKYGICEMFGKPIKIERLRNTPWARFSIEAALQLEHNPHLAESLYNE